MEKICTKCGLSKMLEDFYKKSSTKDGLRSDCKNCVKAHNKKYYADNAEKNSENCRIYRINNRERLLDYYAKWKAENPTIRRECNRKWAEKNAEKDKKSKAKYKKINTDKSCFLASKRRASKNSASPVWLTATQLNQIKWFYSAAKMMTETTGVQHHVDHIHPILGNGFNGLHVPWNLRVIKACENVSKGNRPAKEDAERFWGVNRD